MITHDLERLAERGPHRDPAAVVNAALTEAFARRTIARRTRAMSMAAVSVALLAGGVAALAARERRNSNSTSEQSPAATPDSTIPSTALPPPATDDASTNEVTTDDVEAGTAACAEFQPRYIGNGLTVALPTNAALMDGGSSADPGPLHAATSMTFGFDDLFVEVGRRINGDILEEADVSQRVDGGVVIFVRSGNPDLRACVLASASYDQADDEADE